VRTREKHTRENYEPVDTTGKRVKSTKFKNDPIRVKREKRYHLTNMQDLLTRKREERHLLESEIKAIPQRFPKRKGRYEAAKKKKNTPRGTED